ncbi:MAG TPA: queuosine precursor transporter [Mogibacterium sp.]|nr:queuosine precursor transporter [Mogibacterium sp.]
MRNELLLIITLLIEYTGVVLAYKFFGRNGLYAWVGLATVLANIEVMILVRAFGIEMTLGNVLFATTFLVTDILSENYGKKYAAKGVRVGIASALFFMLVSFSWLMYIPSENDVTSEAFRGLFAYTPRVIISSLVVFVIVQHLDVWLYHKIWDITASKFGNKTKGLWIRNNVATMSSQLVNAVLYNIFAFGGIYPQKTIIQIIVSTLIIYFITSLADTPFLYWARKIKYKKDSLSRQTVGKSN